MIKRKHKSTFIKCRIHKLQIQEEYRHKLVLIKQHHQVYIYDIIIQDLEVMPLAQTLLSLEDLQNLLCKNKL